MELEFGVFPSTCTALTFMRLRTINPIKATEALQRTLNKQFREMLIVDGIYGQNTINALMNRTAMQDEWLNRSMLTEMIVSLHYIKGLGKFGRRVAMLINKKAIARVRKMKH